MDLPQRSNQFLFFCLIPLVSAYTVFETNCSAPSTLSNFVSSPNTRGTLDILWSSLFTILACTWTLQHPNIPEQRDGRDPGRLGDVKWGLKGFYRSTLRMFWTIIAPELIITAACFDLMEVRTDFKRLQEYAFKDDVAWSLSHCYYANMGGFVIRSTSNAGNDYHNPYHLNTRHIYALRQGEHLTKLPDIAEEEIKDKSKGDMFVKLIAVGQIVWSIIQIIARAVRRLAVSPLEVAVVAFATCAVIIYGLYWNKPQRVCVPTTLLQYEKERIPDAVLGALRQAKALDDITFSFQSPLPGAPISLSSDKNMETDDSFLAMGVALAAALFGGIHAVAWNFAFPSTVELVFWRCASIYTAAAPLCIVLLGVANTALDDRSKRLKDLRVSVVKIIIFAAIFLYIVARLFILVEMFRTLCFLPPGSYVSTWTSNIPHVA